MDSDFTLKEWDLKSQIIRRNTNLRRFSASNLKSFREDERCSRTATTISSTVSSPGYTTREKIDPSTYSFTAALKALQSRSECSWEHPPSEKPTLHSKWSDAEKYISNPLSGEVPLECLSAKTLGARSFRTLTNRITVSAPLLYPSHHHFPTKFPITQHHHKLDVTLQEKKKKSMTRDVGIQSVPEPADPSSGSRSPSTPATPSIRERSMKYSEGESGDSSLSTEKEKIQEEEVVEERERKEKEGRKTKGGGGRERKKMMMMRMCSSSSSRRQGGGRRRGCLSFKGLWQREKCKPKKNNKPPPSSSTTSSSPTFLYHINACYDV